MAVYSHSRIETFKQCKLKYKFQYVDRIRVDLPSTVELFLGDIVHQALHWLFEQIAHIGIPTKEALIEKYVFLWKQWTDDIVINRGTKEEYVIKGRLFLTQYYESYHPFDQLEILGLETNDRLELKDGNKYYVRIDKLAKKDTTYYVCDYKTNNALKTQDEVDKDRQLALYSIWVKKRYPECTDVKLVWDFLAHNTQMVSTRSDDELTTLEDDTVRIIATIEDTTHYPSTKTQLCNWCSYKSLCPEWNVMPKQVRQVSLTDF
ncbi:MAG: putative RecB family exonuclease [Candidatus Woesearchaeota archaeon]|jgi:putative RecB family exonuclease